MCIFDTLTDGQGGQKAAAKRPPPAKTRQRGKRQQPRVGRWHSVPKKTCATCGQDTWTLERDLSDDKGDDQPFLEWKREYHTKDGTAHPGGQECYYCGDTRRGDFVITDEEEKQKNPPGPGEPDPVKIPDQKELNQMIEDPDLKALHIAKRRARVRKERTSRFEGRTNMTTYKVEKARTAYDDRYRPYVFHKLWTFVSDRRLPFSKEVDDEEEVAAVIAERYAKEKYKVDYDADGILGVKIYDMAEGSYRGKEGMRDEAKHFKSYEFKNKEDMLGKFDKLRDKIFRGESSSMLHRGTTWYGAEGEPGMEGAYERGRSSVDSGSRAMSPSRPELEARTAAGNEPITVPASPRSPVRSRCSSTAQSSRGKGGGRGSGAIHEPAGQARTLKKRESKESGDRESKESGNEDAESIITASGKKRKRTKKEVIVDQTKEALKKARREWDWGTHWSKRYQASAMENLLGKLSGFGRKLKPSAGEAGSKEGRELMSLSTECFSFIVSLEERAKTFELLDAFERTVLLPYLEPKDVSVMQKGDRAVIARIFMEASDHLATEVLSKPSAVKAIFKVNTFLPFGSGEEAEKNCP